MQTMVDAFGTTSCAPDSYCVDAENATGAYGVFEKPGFTDMWCEAMASGTP